MSLGNFADAWEIVASTVPDRPAQECRERSFTWRQFDRRANALAADLLAAGLGHQAKVAAYLYNGPEYLEVYAAAFKAGLVPVNTNYRYGADELVYLLDNSDAEAVVFGASFTPLLDQIRDRLAKVKRWYAVDDGATGPPWARPYESVVTPDTATVTGPWGRSGDDLLLLYTGGTTGMPKGVMWRQADLWMALGGGGSLLLGTAAPADVDEYRAGIAGSSPLLLLPACPLMHGTGQFLAFAALMAGGCVVTMPDRSFGPARLWQTVADNKVNAIAIVGDAFARPMLSELDAAPQRWDLAGLAAIVSSGVTWSHEVKQALAKHLPTTLFHDALGSSEGGMGHTRSTGDGGAGTAVFTPVPGAKVITDDGREVAPGSGEVGLLAVPGAVSKGYYKDPDKTARTFRTIDGVRHVVAGDHATVEEDGTIRLLGRGSAVINTGGEKVFPEEVDEMLKLHPAVRDAVCVGLPDERFGESVCAIVEPNAGCAVDPQELIGFVKSRLARYKAPRTVITVETIGRTPAGKVDYPALSRMARTHAARNP